jgi:hypothetical protein
MGKGSFLVGADVDGFVVANLHKGSYDLKFLNP